MKLFVVCFLAFCLTAAVGDAIRTQSRRDDGTAEEAQPADQMINKHGETEAEGNDNVNRINLTEASGNDTVRSTMPPAKATMPAPPMPKNILPVQTGVKAQEEEQSSGMSIFFSLLVVGICIILVHLLIKFKLHFLPESVAVVSLGIMMGAVIKIIETQELANWKRLNKTSLQEYWRERETGSGIKPK